MSEGLDPHERYSLTDNSEGIFDIRGHMQEAVLDEWIVALRGDHYQQGQSNLVEEAYPGDDERDAGVYHCCLGVFMELNDGFDQRDANTDGEMLSATYAYDNGLACENPSGDGSDQTHNLQHWLANMNDNQKSFMEIADFLDEQRELITKGCEV